MKVSGIPRSRLQSSHHQTLNRRLQKNVRTNQFFVQIAGRSVPFAYISHLKDNQLDPLDFDLDIGVRGMFPKAFWPVIENQKIEVLAPVVAFILAFGDWIEEKQREISSLATLQGGGHV